MRRVLALLVSVLMFGWLSTTGAAADTHYTLNGSRSCHGVTYTVSIGYYRFWVYPQTGPNYIKVAWNTRAWSAEYGEPRMDWWGQMRQDATGTVLFTVSGTSNDGNAGYHNTGFSQTGFNGVANGPISGEPTIEMRAGKDGDGYAMCVIEAFGL